MKLSIYSYTNQGGREHNEDSLRWTSDGTEGVFVLADGLGGHDRGEVASQLAVEVICGGEDSPVPGREELLERFQQANARILEQQKQPGQEEMKTTAVALSLSGSTAAWAHIGDSRLYRYSQGRMDQLTRDHSVTYMNHGKPCLHSGGGRGPGPAGGRLPAVLRRLLGVRVQRGDAGGLSEVQDAGGVGPADAAAPYPADPAGE